MSGRTIKINITKEIEEMLSKGLSIPKIAKKLNVSDQTVRRRIKKNQDLDYNSITLSKKKKKEKKIHDFEKMTKSIRKKITEKNLNNEDKCRYANEFFLLDRAKDMITSFSFKNKKVNLKTALLTLDLIFSILINKNNKSKISKSLSAASVYVHVLHLPKNKKFTQSEVSNYFKISTVCLRTFFSNLEMSPLKINKYMIYQIKSDKNPK